MSPPHGSAESLVDQLVKDKDPLIIVTNDSSQEYPIQKTFLARVSESLAKRCHQKYTFLEVQEDAFRIFLDWLLYAKIEHVETCRASLARAWNFGARYGMPDFQNAVMRTLVPILQEEAVDSDAVLEAYSSDSGKQLRRALIAELAIDMHACTGFGWHRETFADYSLDEKAVFLMDLIEAMSNLGGIADCDLSSVQSNDFLIVEVID